MVRLFFLAPKRPWRKRIGEVCLSDTGLAGSCNSYTNGTVWVVDDEYDLLQTLLMALSWYGQCRRRAGATIAILYLQVDPLKKNRIKKKKKILDDLPN